MTNVTIDTSGKSTTNNFSYTLTGNCIIVAARESSAGHVTAVTYGGVALTSLGHIESNNQSAGGVALFGKVGGLPTGANTVSITGFATWALVSSYNDAASLGTAVTAAGSGTTVANNGSATVTSTITGGVVVGAVSFGSSGTWTATSPATSRQFENVNASSASGNGFLEDTSSVGGGSNTTIAWSNLDSDWWGMVAVEVQPSTALDASVTPTAITVSTAIPAPTVEVPDANISATVISATTAIPAPTVIVNPPTINALGGTGAGYFVDTASNPKMWLGDEIWALLTNAGRWNSDDYQSTFDTYFSARAGQGFTVCYTDLFNSTFIGGATNGTMWNGEKPFTSDDPSSGLNESYWTVIDYAISSAQANGITLALSLGGHWDWDTSGNAMFGFTSTQYQDAGNAIGTRYKDKSNIVWVIMDDYFSSFDSSLDSLLTGLRASGDTHPISIENYAETTSRFDLSDDSALSWGTSNTQYNFCYSYSCTYLPIEYAYAETSPITVLYGDGYFYQGGSTYSSTLDRASRQDAWWAVTSGARGWNIGDESLWQWVSTAPGKISTQWFAENNAGNIRTFMESLPGWYNLTPATGSALITAGRGTRATQLSSGGGGGQYEPATTNDYVSASITGDGSLAVMYAPVAATITIDETAVGGSGNYTAKKVDPITGTATSITAGSSYDTSSFGNNSQGDPDWVILLETSSTDASITAVAVSAATSIPAPTILAVTEVSPTAVDATTSIPSPAIVASSVISPSAVTASASIPAPGIVSSSVIAATAVNSTVSIPTPGVHVDVAISATAIDASTSLPAPTVSVDVAISPSAVATSTSVPTPTVQTSGSASVNATAVSASASIPTPSIVIGTTVTPSNIAATVSFPASSFSSSVDVPAQVVSGSSSVPMPNIVNSTNVLASAVPATVSIPTPSVSAGGSANVAASAVTASVTIPAPTVDFGMTVSPSAVSAMASVPSVGVVIGTTVAASAVAASVSIPAPTVDTGSSASVSPSAVSATVTIPVPTVSAAQSAAVTPSVVSVSITVPTPAASGSSTVAPSVVALSTSLPAPTVTVSVAIQATAVSASTAIPAPSVASQAEASVTPSVVGASVSLPAPTVSVSVAITPTVISASSSIPTPAVSTGSTVTPTVISASANIPLTTVVGSFGQSSISGSSTSTAEITGAETGIATIGGSSTSNSSETGRS